MKNTKNRSGRVNPAILGFLSSALFSITALLSEPRLLPLAVIAGPALIGLVSPPNGRRVYCDLGTAVLIASAVISIMLFMPATV